MPDTVSVTQADREAAIGIIGSTLDAEQREAVLAGKSDTLSIVQAFARHRLASTQPAPAFPREEVAKIIDPAAWEQRNRHLTKAGEAEYADHAHQWFTRADDVVAASLRTADAIAALLQGKQP